MKDLSNAYTEVLVILLNMENGFFSITYNILEILKKGYGSKPSKKKHITLHKI